MFALVTITEIILAFTKITALFFYKPVIIYFAPFKGATKE